MLEPKRCRGGPDVRRPLDAITASTSPGRSGAGTCVHVRMSSDGRRSCTFVPASTRTSPAGLHGEARSGKTDILVGGLTIGTRY